MMYDRNAAYTWPTSAASAANSPLKVAQKPLLSYQRRLLVHLGRSAVPTLERSLSAVGKDSNLEAGTEADTFGRRTTKPLHKPTAKKKPRQ